MRSIRMILSLFALAFIGTYSASAEMAADAPVRPSIEQLFSVCPEGSEPFAPEAFDVDGIKKFVELYPLCDPTRDFFTTEGKVSDTSLIGEANATFLNMHLIASRLKHLARGFDGLPVLTRRALLEQAGPIVAMLVVEYVHHEHLEEWLLNLDWDRDIEPINPDLYLKTSWPENRFERVNVTSGGPNASRAEFWVRMFWKRRGRLTFEVAKVEIEKAIEAEEKARTAATH